MRTAHFAVWATSASARLHYWPVLACRKFEQAAIALAGGTGDAGPFTYASPLYRFLILPFYAAGAGRAGVFAAQSVAGVLTAVLTMRLARRAGASPLPSFLASLAASLYAPLVLVELTLLPVAFLALLMAVFTCVTISHDENPLRAAAQGLLPGLAAGLRPPLLLSFLVPAAYWVRRKRWLLLVVGLCSMMAPLIFLAHRSRRAGGDFRPFPVSTGLNLALGHNPDATGYGPPAPSWGLLETGQGDIHSVALRVAADSGHTTTAEADRFWTGRALEWAASHPAEELRLLMTKLGGFFGARPFDTYYEMGRAGRFSPVLRLLVLPRWLIVGLFLAGLVPFLRSGSGRTVIMLPIAVTLLAALLFVHSERYFLPVLPLMLAAAASGWTALARAFGSSRRRAVLQAAAGLLLMVPALLYPVPEVPENLYVGSLAFRALDMGDSETALELFERQAVISPQGSLARYQGHAQAALLARELGMEERAEAHEDILERLRAGQSIPR